jgi:hypothetical protein
VWTDPSILVVSRDYLIFKRKKLKLTNGGSGFFTFFEIKGPLLLPLGFFLKGKKKTRSRESLSS